MGVYIPNLDEKKFYEICKEHDLNFIAIPAADVRPVVRGKWIDDKVSFYLGCSECGCYLEYAVDTFLDNGDHYNFCPNCGADMRPTSMSGANGEES